LCCGTGHGPTSRIDGLRALSSAHATVVMVEAEG
jgi:hypothetical protein